MPWAIAGAAAVGIGGSIIGGASDIGKNDAKTKSFGESGQYNPNAFQYGGREGGAADAAAGYGMMANQASNRQLNYGQANAYGQQAADARGQAGQAAGLTMQRAQGLVPSIAGQQAAIDSQRLQAAQASQAASARGAAGLAMANQAAMSNTANGMGMISQQAQVNAANERMQAEQAAYAQYAGLSGLGVQAQQQQVQQAQQQAQMNDQLTLGLLQGQRDVNNNQLNAQVQGQQALSGSWQQNQGLYQQRMQANASRGMDFYKQGLGAAQGGAQAASGGFGGGKP